MCTYICFLFSKALGQTPKHNSSLRSQSIQRLHRACVTFSQAVRFPLTHEAGKYLSSCLCYPIIQLTEHQYVQEIRACTFCSFKYTCIETFSLKHQGFYSRLGHKFSPSSHQVLQYLLLCATVCADSSHQRYSYNLVCTLRRLN